MNIIERKHGYSHLIDWIIHFGDLVLINLFFILVYNYFLPDKIIANYFQTSSEQLGAILMINSCYLLTANLIHLNISLNVIYFDKIVQKSTFFLSVYFILLTAGFSVFNIVNIPFFRWLLVFLVLYVLLLSWHVIFRLLLKKYRRKGYNYKQVIIVGGGINGLKIHESLLHSDFGYKILGFFDDNIERKNVLPNYLGTVSDIREYTENNLVDEVFCTLPGSQEAKISELITFSEKNMIRFHLVPEYHKYIKRKFSLQFLESTPVLSLRHEPLQYFSNRFMKRSFDVLFSGLMLLTLFPLVYLIFGAIIKLSSSGPIFFKQKRTGKDGKIFYCYKFRSMRLNDEAHKKQATEDDPRVTAIGKFMRKTSIDELPQFINVIKGEMSVVGPRPHMLQHTELYSSLIDKFMVRHLVKPGITGWAQVTGFRGETKTVEEMEGRVIRDVWYLENWSFFLDIKIIYLTVANVFKGEANAY